MTLDDLMLAVVLLPTIAVAVFAAGVAIVAAFAVTALFIREVFLAGDDR